MALAHYSSHDRGGSPESVPSPTPADPMAETGCSPCAAWESAPNPSLAFPRPCREAMWPATCEIRGVFTKLNLGWATPPAPLNLSSYLGLCLHRLHCLHRPWFIFLREWSYSSSTFLKHGQCLGIPSEPCSNCVVWISCFSTPDLSSHLATSLWLPAPRACHGDWHGPAWWQQGFPGPTGCCVAQDSWFRGSEFGEGAPLRRTTDGRRQKLHS